MTVKALYWHIINYSEDGCWNLLMFDKSMKQTMRSYLLYGDLKLPTITLLQ